MMENNNHIDTVMLLCINMEIIEGRWIRSTTVQQSIRKITNMTNYLWQGLKK